MNCKNCNKPLKFVGWQGNVKEYKCPKCGKYFYGDNFSPDYEAGMQKFNQSFHEDKHETLNVKLFDGDELKKEVKDKLLKIKDKFVKTLSEDDIDLDVKDVVIVGSNVNYNYTENSDIDLHIIADLTNYDDEAYNNLLEKTYNAYKSLFNNKYDLTIYGIPVEIYVESWREDA